MAWLPQPQPHIRKATPQDAQTIADLGTHVFTVTQGPHMPPADLSAYLSRTFSISATISCLQNPLSVTFVAVDALSSSILGFALLTRGEVEACVSDELKATHLQRIYVYPHAQEQGVGKLLVKSIEVEAKEQGYENLWLRVYEGNHRAIAVYEKLGFERVGTHDFVTKTAGVWTDLVMLKSISV